MIVEDLGIVRGALTAVLSAEPDLDVTAEAAGEAVFAAVAEQRPDVIIIDVDQYDTPGLSVVRRLALELPDCGILALTGRITPRLVRAVIATNVRGLVSKDTPPEQLAALIRRIAGGERVVDPGAVAAALRAAANPLTAREREILRLAGDGLANKAIAAKLFLSPGTVRNHLYSAMRKLGIGDRLAAARRADELGWL
jgi:two-component system response regulator DesR